MLEMAAHIGAYDTLRIVDAFAGQTVYVPMNASRNPFVEVVGADKATILSHVYGAEKLPIPTGRQPLAHARRQAVIAAIRSGSLSVSKGAAMLRMPRRHLSHLVNQTNEGTDCEPVAALASRHDARQIDMFYEVDG